MHDLTGPSGTDEAVEQRNSSDGGIKVSPRSITSITSIQRYLVLSNRNQEAIVLRALLETKIKSGK
jgi:hypothetical protein